MSLRKSIGEVALPFIICKFYCFLKVFVILFFNQYLISRLSSPMSSAKKRNIVDEKRVFQKDWTDIRYVYDLERIQREAIVPSFPLFDSAF